MKQTNNGKVNKALKGIVLLRNVAILLLAVVCAFSGSTVAWISGSNEIQPQVASSVITNYFEFGQGTADDPFIIHSPRHLYNLAWLQYLGQFNNYPNTADPDGIYHFKICPHAGEDPCASSAATTGDGSAAVVLDMKDWVLPPIGTPQFPFLGDFDGNGCTISNLTVTDNYSVFTDPGDTEDNFVKSGSTYAANSCGAVGLFGVVGPIGGNATGSNAVYDVNIDNLTATASSSSKSLVGIAAAYVNAPVSGVTITGENTSVSSVGGAMTDLGATNASNYSLVGYCTTKYKDKLTVSEVNVMAPETYAYQYTYNGKGRANAGEGSIDMYEMHTRLGYIFRNYTQDFSYYSNETWTYPDPDMPDYFEKSNKLNLFTPTIAYSGGSGSDSKLHWYYTTTGGSISFHGKSNYSTTNNSFLYLNGGSAKGTLNVHIVRVAYKDEDAYAISDGQGNYLKYDFETGQLNNADSLETATQWVVTANEIYTSKDKTNYYLVNDGENLVVRETSSTDWIIKTNSIGCEDIQSGLMYSIGYNDGWGLVAAQRYKIAQPGSGVSSYDYLSLDSTGSVGVDSNPLAATVWNYAGNNLYTVRNGSKVYLYNNGGVAAVTARIANAAEFSVSDNAVLTKDRYALQLVDGQWVFTNAKQFITDASGNNYLSLDGFTIVNRTNEAQATGWYLDDSNRITNGTYYLKVSSGKLTATTDASDMNLTQWQQDAGTGAFYITDTRIQASGGSSRKYYITFNGSNWVVTSDGLRYFKIGNSGATRWLSVSGTTINRVQNENSATEWIYDGTYLYTYNAAGEPLYFNTTRSGSGTRLSPYAYDPTVSTTGKMAVYFDRANNRVYINALYRTNGTMYNYYFSISNNAFSLTTTATTSTIREITVPSYSADNYGRLTAAANTTDLTISTEESVVSRLLNGKITVVNKTESDETRPVDYPTTYFPLAIAATQTDETPSYTNPESLYVARNNTGYVVSGQNNAAGDIRVSRYGTNSVSNKTILTRSYKTNNASVAVNTTNYQDYGLEKFARSYDDFSTSITSGLYGLHFMKSNDSIGTAHLITADYVCILDNDYYDYQLPESSIDFKLNQSGFINFYAGTYYDGNNSFFALHEINRDPLNPEKILTIKEIEYVYGKLKSNGLIDTSVDYVYSYVGAEVACPAGYSTIFDTKWITNPGTRNNNFVDDRFYYFEIPANAGEYCLGSVANKDGAYLLYLDLCTNGQFAQRQEVQECWTVTDYDYEYAKGVDLVSSVAEEAVNAGKFSLTLPAGTNTVAVSKDDNEITYAPAKGTVTCLSGNLTANGSPDATGTKAGTEIHKRVTYYDINEKTGFNYRTVFDYVKTAAGAQTVTHKVYKIETSADGSVIENEVTATLETNEELTVSSANSGGAYITTVKGFCDSKINWSKVGSEDTSDAILTYRYDKPASAVTHEMEYTQTADLSTYNWPLPNPPVDSSALDEITSGISDRKYVIDITCTDKPVVAVDYVSNKYTFTLEGKSPSKGDTFKVN